jgi:peptidoglycan/LPS O-acetylase OafA/YrhL
MKERFESLDGLRGIAAVIVVFCHFASVYIPDLPPWFKDSPLEILDNGSFCVSIFFVLSGFVIANSASNANISFIFNAMQRYLRLALPALGGTLWGWGLFKLYPHSLVALKTIHTSAWLEKSTYAHMPSILAAVSSGLLGIFVSGVSRFDGVLWTMKVEFIGSLAVYALYSFIPKSWKKISLFVLPIVLGFVIRKPEYSAFFIGAGIRELRVTGRLPSAYAHVALVFGLIIGAFTPENSKFWHAPNVPTFVALGSDTGVWQILGAGAIIYAIFGLPKIRAFLESDLAQFFGRISFGLYLVHWPLLFTVFVPMYMLAHTSLIGMSLLFIVFMPAVLLLGTAFTELVDQPVIKVIRLVKKRHALPGIGFSKPFAASNSLKNESTEPVKAQRIMAVRDSGRSYRNDR